MSNGQDPLVPESHAHHAVHPHGHEPPAAGAIQPFEDPGQESLNQALRAGFNVLRLLMLALLVAYLASGMFTVDAGEQGLIVRLGKLREAEAGTPVFREGWHWALPSPFDEKIRISGETYALTIDTFSFARTSDQIEARQPLSEILPNKAQLEPGKDGAMLSGDRNLSHGLWTVYYRIVDAGQYVQNVGADPEDIKPILQRLAENAISQAAAERSIDQIIRTGIDTMRNDVTELLREMLASLDTGVEIDKLEAETIEPGSVRRAFRMVTDAQNERQLLIERAYERRNEILAQTAGSRESYNQLLAAIERYGAAQAAGADQSRLQELLVDVDQALSEAGGEVAVRMQEARSQANEARESLRREYESYARLRDLHRQNPELVTLRLWSAMRERVLNNKQNEPFFVAPVGEIEILVNRDPQRALEAERERMRREMMGGAPPQ